MNKGVHSRLKILLDGYLSSRLSSDEANELMSHAADPDSADALKDLLGEAFHRESGETMDEKRRHRVIRRITGIFSKRGVRPLLNSWLPYAAAILIASITIAWMFYASQIKERYQIVNLISEDIAPGTNRATLTLADGRTIDLSSEQAGIVVADGITYLDGSTVFGESVTSGVDEDAHSREQSHTLTLATPKGGTYQITLPDGSKVWLNANSTLKYPARFHQGERIVELVGEAYFDIVRRDLAPFKVLSAGQEVEVLGTEFNITAYHDEAETKTTLVEGKVQIKNRKSQIVNQLRPGQQSVVREVSTETRQTDVYPYIAWRDGWIVLENTQIDAVIRQLERWYDVSFEVREWPSGFKLEGKIERNVRLSTILQALELHTGKKLTIAGRRIMEEK